MGTRLIEAKICESRSLSETSVFAQDLYKRLITYADDYGRFNADVQIMLPRLFPREMQSISTSDIDDALTELVGVGKIAFYTSEPRDEIYGCFPKWSEHQRIRDSKRHCPEPTDTTINDWYLRRFIPRKMKEAILTRDGFKCQECGKYICTTPMDPARLVKMATGTFHIDHIVPVQQGGRATEENLRLLCPHCNLSRKREFTVDEILEMTQSEAKNKNSRQLSATFRNSPQISASSNPIQSNPIHESESESSSSSKSTRAEREKDDDGDDNKLFQIYQDQQEVLDAWERAGFPTNTTTLDKVVNLFSKYGKGPMLDAISTTVEANPRSPLQYLRAVLDPNHRPRPAKAKNTNPACNFQQRDYDDETDEMVRMMMEWQPDDEKTDKTEETK